MQRNEAKRKWVKYKIGEKSASNKKTLSASKLSVSLRSQKDLTETQKWKFQLWKKIVMTEKMISSKAISAFVIFSLISGSFSAIVHRKRFEKRGKLNYFINLFVSIILSI